MFTSGKEDKDVAPIGLLTFTHLLDVALNDNI